MSHHSPEVLGLNTLDTGGILALNEGAQVWLLVSARRAPRASKARFECLSPDGSSVPLESQTVVGAYVGSLPSFDPPHTRRRGSRGTCAIRSSEPTDALPWVVYIDAGGWSVGERLGHEEVSTWQVIP